MKVSREQAARNRERIVETAAQLFRERGFEGIGVADLMKEAGLTHGGFYGHFSSKEDLIAEASTRALMRSLAVLSKVAERAPGDPLSAVAEAYLTSRHRDNPGAGCLLAALGPDVSRQGPAVRRSVTDYVRGAVDLLATLVAGRSKAARRQKAISTQHWSAPWSWRAQSMIVRCPRKSWMPAWRLSKLDAGQSLCARITRKENP